MKARERCCSLVRIAAQLPDPQRARSQCVEFNASRRAAGPMPAGKEKEPPPRRGVLFFELATLKGLEPSTSAVTGRRSNQLSYNARQWWARLGLNQRPPACEADALPLSYAPDYFGSPPRPNENGVYRIAYPLSIRTWGDAPGLARGHRVPFGVGHARSQAAATADLNPW